jgi:hypothetical protein
VITTMPTERRTSLVFDPVGLSRPQRDGRACVVCMKAWPLPEVQVGRLPDDADLYACAECADLLPDTAEILVPVPASRPRLDLHYLTDPVRTLIERVQARHISP